MQDDQPRMACRFGNLVVGSLIDSVRDRRADVVRHSVVAIDIGMQVLLEPDGRQSEAAHRLQTTAHRPMQLDVAVVIEHLKALQCCGLGDSERFQGHEELRRLKHLPKISNRLLTRRL